MINLTFWKFIIELKKLQAKRDIYYEILVAGNNHPPTKRKFIDDRNRILMLVQNFGTKDPIEYLRELAHNFVMNH